MKLSLSEWRAGRSGRPTGFALPKDSVNRSFQVCESTIQAVSKADERPIQTEIAVSVDHGADLSPKSVRPVQCHSNPMRWVAILERI
ncbi:MAG: hypothetical protein MUF23_17820 [Pirellula sp.]|nr:hypothetical protein [Pirellula sp.]